MDRLFRPWRLLAFAVLIAVGAWLIISNPAKAMAQASKAAYVGAESNCRMCHSDLYSGWAKTAHAKAFTVLENVGKTKDAACLPCHTTGYGDGGFKDDAATPNLKGVQCEACHGPGGNHNGAKEKITGSPLAKTCAKCHINQGIHGK